MLKRLWLKYLLELNLSALINDPPTANTPEGSVVVPALIWNDPVDVAFVSPIVQDPPPANKRFANEDPFALTVKDDDVAVNFSVLPEFAVNDPPSASNPRGIANVPNGSVTVPAEIKTCPVVVA